MGPAPRQKGDIGLGERLIFKPGERNAAPTPGPGHYGVVPVDATRASKTLGKPVIGRASRIRSPTSHHGAVSEAVAKKWFRQGSEPGLLPSPGHERVGKAKHAPAFTLGARREDNTHNDASEQEPLDLDYSLVEARCTGGAIMPPAAEPREREEDSQQPVNLGSPSLRSHVIAHPAVGWGPAPELETKPPRKWNPGDRLVLDIASALDYVKPSGAAPLPFGDAPVRSSSSTILIPAEGDRLLLSPNYACRQPSTGTATIAPMHSSKSRLSDKPEDDNVPLPPVELHAADSRIRRKQSATIAPPVHKSGHKSSAREGSVVRLAADPTQALRKHKFAASIGKPATVARRAKGAWLAPADEAPLPSTVLSSKLASFDAMADELDAMFDDVGIESTQPPTTTGLASAPEKTADEVLQSELASRLKLFEAEADSIGRLLDDDDSGVRSGEDTEGTTSANGGISQAAIMATTMHQQGIADLYHSVQS